MATTTPALLTLEEYLRTVYHPDCDFVDDHLEERNVGEEQHSTIQGEIIFWFNSRRDEWNIRVNPEYRTRVGPTRVRIPDVTIVSRTGPRERIRETPALLCIEVLSPEDRLPRVKIVLGDFLTMGVQNIWLIDPYTRTAYTYTAEGLLQATTDTLQIPGTPIHLHLPTIFASLD